MYVPGLCSTTAYAWQPQPHRFDALLGGSDQWYLGNHVNLAGETYANCWHPIAWIMGGSARATS